MRYKSEFSRFNIPCALICGITLILVGACGSDKDDPAGPQEPTGVVMEASATEVQVSEQVEIAANPIYDREGAEFDWYVNDELGGHESTGTITQTNPATFTAPAAVPAGVNVEIKAIYKENEEIFATEMLEVRFTVKHVDGERGADLVGGGSSAAPFATISYAFARAEAGDTVLVQPGNYGFDYGEAEQFVIPDEVVLKGTDPYVCILHGWPEEYYSVRTGMNTTLENFTVKNGGAGRVAVYANKPGVVRYVRIVEMFMWSAIRSTSGEETLIENCEVINTSNPGSGRGFELISGCHATLRGCTVSGWGTGIFSPHYSDPLIEYCTITDNQVGVELWGDTEEGPPPGEDADLGGGARGSMGGNTIQGNAEWGLWIRHETTDIYAIGNTWDNDPPLEGPPGPADYYVELEEVELFLE